MRSDLSHCLCPTILATAMILAAAIWKLPQAARKLMKSIIFARGVFLGNDFATGKSRIEFGLRAGRFALR